MREQNRESIFVKYGLRLTPLQFNKNLTTPLKEHPQIPLIIDVLSRKERHHVALLSSFSEKINVSLMESLAQHLTNYHIPKTLRDIEFIYLDAAKLSFSALHANEIEQDFQRLGEELRNNRKRILFGINQLLFEESAAPLKVLEKMLNTILPDNDWRLIAFTSRAKYQICKSRQPYFDHYFYALRLSEPNENESLSIFKKCRGEIETFHQVVIPDETFAHAFSMARYYINGSQPYLDKAFELLDMSAARASAIERNEQGEQVKPVVSNNMVGNVVSNWTQIPLSHLQNNKFKASEFVQAMQRLIYGQEAAITLMGLVLQQGRIKLQEKSSSLCSFLFVGPPNVGKTETAYAMAEQLFGHKRALLHINLDRTKTPTSLAEIKIMTRADETQGHSLFEAIQQTPYAVVFIENINRAPIGTLELFEDVFTQGYATDQAGNKYDFRHAIIVIATTLGAERITSLIHPQSAEEAVHSVDLMQLVLNDAPNNATTHQQQHLSPHELCEEVLPLLENYFSANLLRHLNIIPFVPLDYAASEKIIRMKLKILGKQLDAHFGIELSYATEIIRFLVHQVLWRRETTTPIDKLLEQHLYACVAHELVAFADDKNRPKRLLLQLNETGQLLHCEFVAANDAALYKL